MFPSLHTYDVSHYKRWQSSFPFKLALLVFLLTPFVVTSHAEAKEKAHVEGEGKKPVSDKSLKKKKKSEKVKSKKSSPSSSSDGDSADKSPLDGASSEAPKEDLFRRAVLFFNRQNGATKEVPLKSEELQKAAEQFLKTASDSSVDSPPAVNDGESVSRKFMKIFDKREEAKETNEALSVGRLLEGRGVTVEKPEGWVVEKNADTDADPDRDLVIVLTQAGEPNNRIEVRKGVNIAPSKRLQYLDSFRTNVENAGFEPDFEMGEDSDNTLHVKRRFGGQTGNYIKFHVGDVDVTNPLRGNTKVGLLLFLFEGKEDAWIFAAFSTVGEINQIEPIFQKFIETAQFTAK